MSEENKPQYFKGFEALTKSDEAKLSNFYSYVLGVLKIINDELDEVTKVGKLSVKASEHLELSKFYADELYNKFFSLNDALKENGLNTHSDN